jgi:hypothetical protein
VRPLLDRWRTASSGLISRESEAKSSVCLHDAVHIRPEDASAKDDHGIAEVANRVTGNGLYGCK